MPPKDPNDPKRTSAEEAALRIKLARVLARLDRDAATLANGPIFRARIGHLMAAPSDAAGQLPCLAFASIWLDRIQEDPDRRLGQQVRGGARQRAAKTRQDASKDHHKWQRRAEQIWSRRPDLSKSAVARIVAQGTDDQPNTARLHIRRPETQSRSPRGDHQVPRGQSIERRASAHRSQARIAHEPR